MSYRFPFYDLCLACLASDETEGSRRFIEAFRTADSRFEVYSVSADIDVEKRQQVLRRCGFLLLTERMARNCEFVRLALNEGSIPLMIAQGAVANDFPGVVVADTPEGLLKKLLSIRISPDEFHRVLLNRQRHFSACGTEENRSTGSVSVIIPTYRPNDYIFEAVRSVKDQTYPSEKIEIIISVNGGDRDYCQQLQRKYAGDSQIMVLLTSRKGANAGRNNGVRASTKDFVTFLDDDDYFTPGYIAELMRGFVSDDINLSAGLRSRFDQTSGKLEVNPIIHKAYVEIGGGVIEDWSRISVLLSLLTCMIFRKKFYLEAFDPLDESEPHSEDLIFWAENCGRLRGRIYVQNPSSSESYVWRETADSLSRPLPERQYAFNVTDRLHLMDRLQRVMFDPNATLRQKKFVQQKLAIQPWVIQKYIKAADKKTAARATAEVLGRSDCWFLNKSRFSNCPAIAFCHNFSPSVDASAMVATKRLREIDLLAGTPLQWHVISQDMGDRCAKDDDFQGFYADYVCCENKIIGGSTGFMPELNKAYVKSAIEQAQRWKAEVIYSRSFFVGSHMAAYEYKKKHPHVVWYAEFSDPVAYNLQNRPYVCQGNPTWFEVEKMVYELADVIIYTNENQREYMLSYNPEKQLENSIRNRSIIMRHPVLPREFCGLTRYDYALDLQKINVGFFGRFYANRTPDDLVGLLSNKDVQIHLFTPSQKEVEGLKARYGNRIKVNPTVRHFEFLNLGSRFDYLVLSDIDFPAEINPFLPSKYADYLATGARIIAKVRPGSILSKERNGRLIAVDRITEDIARSLTRRSDVRANGVAGNLPLKVLFACAPGNHKGGNPFVGTLGESLVKLGVTVDYGERYLDDAIRGKYDIVHIMWPEELWRWKRDQITDAAILALKEKLDQLKRAGIRICYTRHNIRPHVQDKSRLCEAYELIERMADVVFHMGEFSKEDFLRTYPESKARHVILPHHTYSRIPRVMTKAQARKKLGLSMSDNVVLSFGVFRFEEERRLLREAVKSCGVPDVKILAPRYSDKNEVGIFGSTGGGAVPEEDLPAYFIAADVVFLQRLKILNSGNLPMAYHFGRVCVGPDAGNVGEILKSTGNPTFDSNDILSAAVALKQGFLLAKETRLGMSNLIFANTKWREDIIAEQLLEAYRRQ